MTWTVLHLEHPQRPGRAWCGATSGRIVSKDMWRDNRVGKACPNCGPKREKKARKR